MHAARTGFGRRKRERQRGDAESAEVRGEGKRKTHTQRRRFVAPGKHVGHLARRGDRRGISHSEDSVRNDGSGEFRLGSKTQWKSTGLETRHYEEVAQEVGADVDEDGRGD
jgi:hypothetical protein